MNNQTRARRLKVRANITYQQALTFIRQRGKEAVARCKEQGGFIEDHDYELSKTVSFKKKRRHG